MPPQVNVESAFADFVRRYGGEVVEDIVAPHPISEMPTIYFVQVGLLLN